MEVNKLSLIKKLTRRRSYLYTFIQFGSFRANGSSQDSFRKIDQNKTCDTPRFARFFHEMLRRGVSLAPSQFEALFLSSAHTVEQIDATVRAAEKVLRRLRA